MEFMVKTSELRKKKEVMVTRSDHISDLNVEENSQLLKQEGAIFNLCYQLGSKGWCHENL